MSMSEMLMDCARNKDADRDNSDNRLLEGDQGSDQSKIKLEKIYIKTETNDVYIQTSTRDTSSENMSELVDVDPNKSGNRLQKEVPGSYQKNIESETICVKTEPDYVHFIPNTNDTYTDNATSETECGPLDESIDRDADINGRFLIYAVQTPSNPNKPCKCNVCGKAFALPQQLPFHMRVHVPLKLYTCETCGDSFSQKRLFDAHLPVHSTEERPHRCDVCGRTFHLKWHLMFHMRAHTTEKPYVCNRCGKSFTRKFHLDKHFVVHTGKRPYKCDACTKGFCRPQGLVAHMRIHTSEKPYECGECGKTFKWTSALKQHVKTHTEKEHRCDACGWSAKRKISRRMRTRVSLSSNFREQSAGCDKCGKGFCIDEMLRDHIVKAHGGTKRENVDERCGSYCQTNDMNIKEEKDDVGDYSSYDVIDIKEEKIEDDENLETCSLNDVASIDRETNFESYQSLNCDIDFKEEKVDIDCEKLPIDNIL